MNCGPLGNISSNLQTAKHDSRPGQAGRGHVRQRGVISAVALGHRQAAFAVMCSG